MKIVKIIKDWIADESHGQRTAEYLAQRAGISGALIRMILRGEREESGRSRTLSACLAQSLNRTRGRALGGEALAMPFVTCNRCGWHWWPRSPQSPKKCPACDSPYWDKPRVYRVKRKARMRGRRTT